MMMMSMTYERRCHFRRPRYRRSHVTFARLLFLHFSPTDFWGKERLFAVYSKASLVRLIVILTREFIIGSHLWKGSPYWNGTSLQPGVMRRVFSTANDSNLFLMIFHCLSRTCKQYIPVKYREHEYGLPCIRQLPLQYLVQSKLSCPTAGHINSHLK